ERKGAPRSEMYVQRRPLPPIIIQTGTRPARAGSSPRAPAAPGRRSLAPLATGTVQTITISRHFAAEPEGEKAQTRPRDKQKYNQLTPSLQTGKGDCATTTTCSGPALSRSLPLPPFLSLVQRGVCVPGTSAQINKHCSCSASSGPARPS
ncbi:hypothetical protein HPG69_012400, partial [Diceros bicornis minor]